MQELMEIAYNETQCLDLRVADRERSPLVVFIHGGGFFTGDKRGPRQAQIIERLEELEISWASINYTLAKPEQRFGTWPRNFCDVADAFTFLGGNAPRFGYDMTRLGLMGFSAGCCLAGLYSFGGKRLLDTLGYESQWFQPKAFVGMYGPFDFETRQPHRRSGDPVIDQNISPAYWLRQIKDPGSLPSVFHIQGDLDEVVIPAQHAEFEEAYVRAGGRFRGLLVPDFGHTFSPADTNDRGKSIDLRDDIVGFFTEHLG